MTFNAIFKHVWWPLFWLCITLAIGFAGANGTPYGWIGPAFWFGWSMSKFHNAMARF